MLGAHQVDPVPGAPLPQNLVQIRRITKSTNKNYTLESVSIERPVRDLTDDLTSIVAFWVLCTSFTCWVISSVIFAMTGSKSFCISML
jgi:hypothetical protein